MAILSVAIRPSAAQDDTTIDATAPQAAAAQAPAYEDGTLHFAFDRTPWRDVISWLAESSNLALHVTDVPSGSFSYSDDSQFTPQQALDRVNLFLLPQGFTLVRSGKLLSVINLSDPRSVQQLDSLARRVTVDQLDDLENHEVARCFFPLTELQPEEAIEELTALNLMTTPAVFPRTNQILVTDTAGKLKNVKAILDAFEPHALANGTVVKTFMLQHVDAEEILSVARPHLGLATGEMIGIDVSVSAAPQGRSIFVTGIQDKVKMLEGLITEIDQPEKSLRPESGTAELRSHPVLGGDVETVYNVLQTLLATESRPIRLSVDETAGSIVALATPDIQDEIAETVAKLAGSESEFEVIPLRNVDPYFAIGLLEEMLDLSEAETTDYRRNRDDDEPAADVPKIDADPANMRLFVRGKRHQIEQIKSIIAGLDTTESAENPSSVRLFPLRGPQAEATLEAAAKFWRAPNPIVLLPAIASRTASTTERIVAESDNAARSVFGVQEEPQPRERLLTKNPFSTEPEIVCQLSPRGLLLQSDDGKALDQFEEHLRLIAGNGLTAPSPPIVFYLKYTRAEDALRMLAELFDGGASVREVESGSLVNAFVMGDETTYGSLLTSRDGMTTMIVGSITIVADSRLNRLIAQGTAEDLDQIEGYLKIIDKAKGITEIETYGTSQVIELTYARASEVADAIRAAYAGRVAGGQAATGASGKPQPGAPQPQDKRDDNSKSSDKSNNDKKPSKKDATPQAARNLEPRMTIAVHEPSNSLIVTAPEQLFREVERLAKLIDQRSRKKVEIITLPNTSAVESLREIFSGGTGRGSSSGSGYSRVPKPSSSKTSAIKVSR